MLNVKVPWHSRWLWLSVGLLLCTICSLAPTTLLCCCGTLLAGVSLVTLTHSKQVLDKHKALRTTYPQVLFEEKYQNVKSESGFIDERLTGSTIIDDPLQEVLHYTFRDYINTWYSDISDDQNFLLNLKDLVRKVIVGFSNRFKEVEWVQYLTTKLVDDFASHLRLFRKAQSSLKDSQKNDPTMTVNLLTLFFDFETTMEDNLSRNLVCTSRKCEYDYLQELCEVIMYIVLPNEDFQNLVSRLMLREIVVNSAVLPVVNLLTDPDYINQIIVWMCRETPLTTDGFLLVLQCTDSCGELQAVHEIVGHEIAVLRSRDAGGDDDAEIKQQLGSLFFVQRVVELQMKRLSEGCVDTDSTGMPTGIDWKVLSEPDAKLFSLHFDVVLTNNIALHYFTDFMSALSAQGYVFFYHSVESYKVSAEQMLSSGPDSECLREAAAHIFDLYLSDKATLRVKLDEALTKKIIIKIRTDMPTSSWFDEAQNKVYEIMQEDPYFPTFKKSQNYIKLLAELDLLKEGNTKSEDEGIYCGKSSKISGDNVSLSDSIGSFDPDEDPTDLPESPQGSVFSEQSGSEVCEITAQIYNTGISNESGSPFAVYAISVTRKDSGGPEEKWNILRRYSDFRDFHFILVQKFPQLSSLQFPGKKAFNNLSPRFLERRAEQLGIYLRCVTSREALHLNPGLSSFLLQHLLQPPPERKLPKKVESTAAGPLYSSVRSMSSMVRAMPDSIVDGLRGGIGRVLGAPRTASDDSGKVAAGLDIEGEDNIPLRILLLLMDEIFELKSKDQWFRRRIVALLRQIINATHGDAINRKILDFVQRCTSAEQIGEYIKTFREALWPNGAPAVPVAERETKTKMRTRVAAKLLMLCSVPEELKRVIGSETTRKGVMCVFELLQRPELNRRFLYALLEGMLHTLFPANNLTAVLRTLHRRSAHNMFDTAEHLQMSPVMERKSAPDL